MTGSHTSRRISPIALQVLLLALVTAAVFAFQLVRSDRTQADDVFTVNRIGDGSDEDLTDDICEVTDGIGDCTLRAAIQQADGAIEVGPPVCGTGGDGDRDTIRFDPGLFTENSPATIKLTAPLDCIDEDLIIDAINRGVIIDGNAVVSDGLTVQTDGFEIRGGGATLTIRDFTGHGIAIDGDADELSNIDIDGVDLFEIDGNGIDISNTTNASGVTLTNNDMVTGGDGIKVDVDSLGADLDDNNVEISGNEITAGGEGVDIDFEGDLGSNDDINVNVDNNLDIDASAGEDAVDIKYCGFSSCDASNANINFSVSNNKALTGADEAVNIVVNANDGSSNADTTIDVDGNQLLLGLGDEGVDIFVDACCATSDSTTIVSVDGNGDIRGGVLLGGGDGVDIEILGCCGNNNDATVSVSQNRDISGGGGADGVDIFVDVLNGEPGTSNNNDVTINVNQNRDITGDDNAVVITSLAGSDAGEADRNNSTVNVNNNDDITGGGDGVAVTSVAGTTSAGADGEVNSSTVSVSGNGDIEGDSGVRVDSAALGDDPAQDSANDDNDSTVDVNNNGNIDGTGDDAVAIGSTVCCDSDNRNIVNVNGNRAIRSATDEGVDINGFGIGNGDDLFLCCSENTISVSNNTGTITGGGPAGDGIRITACGTVAGIDPDCLDESTTIATIAKNTISTSGENGVYLCCGDFGDPDGTRSVITANLISGKVIGAGVWIDNASGVRVGPSNVITLNAFAGVVIAEENITGAGSPEADGNTITRNSIFDNTAGGAPPNVLGIDLDGNQVTKDPNPCAGVAGHDPNNCLKSPDLLLLDGTKLTGIACGNCIVELFQADNSPADQNDGSGNPRGEGKTFLASGTASLTGQFSFNVCGANVGDQFTATATNQDGDTSEFSKNLTVLEEDLPACPSGATPTPGTPTTPAPTSTTAPTSTPVPPTDTPVPPTDTPVPPTDTPVPPSPTNTPVPPSPTNTPVPPSPTPTRTPTPAKDCGDVNDDGRVNSVDAALILQLTARLISSLINAPSGDVNDSGGAPDAIDAALILQFEAGLIDEGDLDCG